MKLSSIAFTGIDVIIFSGCTQFSSYKGSYYSPSEEKTLELEGTGCTLVGDKKFPLSWEDPIFNHVTGLEDKQIIITAILLIKTLAKHRLFSLTQK